jgi:hypothetical protein
MISQIFSHFFYTNRFPQRGTSDIPTASVARSSEIRLTYASHPSGSIGAATAVYSPQR